MSSKVIDFGTNRKRVCNSLFVRRDNLGHILPLFRDIADFLLITPPLFHRNFGAFPLDQIADVGDDRSEDPRLIIREIIVEVFQRM